MPSSARLRGCPLRRQFRQVLPVQGLFNFLRSKASERRAGLLPFALCRDLRNISRAFREVSCQSVLSRQRLSGSLPLAVLFSETRFHLTFCVPINQVYFMELKKSIAIERFFATNGKRKSGEFLPRSCSFFKLSIMLWVVAL